MFARGVEERARIRRARWPALPASSVAAKPIESLLVVDAPALEQQPYAVDVCFATHARCNGVMPLRSSQASSRASSSSSSSSWSRTARRIALRWSVAPPAAA